MLRRESCGDFLDGKLASGQGDWDEAGVGSGDPIDKILGEKCDLPASDNGGTRHSESITMLN